MAALLSVWLGRSVGWLGMILYLGAAESGVAITYIVTSQTPNSYQNSNSSSYFNQGVYDFKDKLSHRATFLQDNKKIFAFKEFFESCNFRGGDANDIHGNWS